MNRFLKIIGATFAVAVAATSCDSITDSDDTGTVDLSTMDFALTVNLSEDQKLSSGYSTGTIEGTYDLRVVVELRNSESASIVADREVLYISESSLTSSSSVVANLSIVPGEYDALVWCDYVATAEKESEYRSLAYEPADLRGVTITTDTHAVESNVLRRAFAGKKIVDLTEYEGTLRGTAEDEIDVVSVVGGYVLTTTSTISTYASKVTYTSMPSSFNVSTGEVNATKASAAYKPTAVEVSGTNILGFDYILMDDQSRSLNDVSSTKIDLTVNTYTSYGVSDQVYSVSNLEVFTDQSGTNIATGSVNN
ncbi:MAG: DUF6562 domain-containing protein [Rikenellaceae bacterium]